MTNVKWIKIATDIFDDEKILLIESLPSADEIIVIWFKLLCLAGKNNNDGVFMMNDRIAYTDEMLATIFRRNVNTVKLALKTFEDFGMIETLNGVISIPNWNKHQDLQKLKEHNEYMRNYMANRRAAQKALTTSKTEEIKSTLNTDVNKGVNTPVNVNNNINNDINVNANVNTNVNTDVNINNPINTDVNVNKQLNDVLNDCKQGCKLTVNSLEEEKNKININTSKSKALEVSSDNKKILSDTSPDTEPDLKPDLEPDLQPVPFGTTKQFDQIAEQWNVLKDYGITPVRIIGPNTERGKMLRARLRQYGFESFAEIVEQIKRSEFLQGKNSKAWQVTFDWVVHPSNYAKVLEGNYAVSRKEPPLNKGARNFVDIPSSYASEDFKALEEQLLDN